MNEFKIKKGLIIQGSGSTLLDTQGSQGQLFSITDDLSGSLFSVNDISGIPIMEVFSDNTINLGTFGAEAILISGSTANITGSLSGNSSTSTTLETARTLTIGDTGKTFDGSTNVSWSLDEIGAKPALTTLETGTNITFTKPTIYNTSITPSTDNITNDLTNAIQGVVQKIYHNHSIAPTVPATWILMGGGIYIESVLNVIYAEFAGGTRVEYWIIQEA